MAKDIFSLVARSRRLSSRNGATQTYFNYVMKYFLIFVLCCMMIYSCVGRVPVHDASPEDAAPYTDAQTDSPVDIPETTDINTEIAETTAESVMSRDTVAPSVSAVDITTVQETEPVITPVVSSEAIVTPDITVPRPSDTSKELTVPETVPETEPCDTTPETTAHVHQFFMKETVDASPLSDGYDVYQCECGAVEHRNIVPRPDWMTVMCTMNDLTVLCPNLQDDWIDEIRYAHIRDTDTTKEKYYLTSAGAEHFDEIIAYEIVHTGENPDIYKSFLIKSSDWDAALEARTRWARSREAFFAFYGLFATAVGDEYIETAVHAHNPHYFEIQDWADDVIKQLGITTQTSQYNAIDVINQYLCDNFHYDNTIDDRYEAFQKRSIRCYEYCVLFQLLCAKCGVECDYVRDTKINHAFNSVTFPDGTVRYIDVAWNDHAVKYKGEYVEAEYAKLSQEEYYSVRHSYFLMDENDFAKNHSW